MAYFSPSIQEQFSSAEFQYSNLPTGPTKLGKFYTWKGSFSAWCALIAQIREDKSTAADRFRRANSRMADDWAGISNADQASFRSSSISADALSAFNQASGKLHAERLIPGQALPSIQGAWVIPLVLASNPMAARLKAKTRLPPVDISVSLTISGGIKAERLADPLARLAHAAWEYIELGGVVRLSASYSSAFSVPQDGHRGLVATIEVPLTNKAAFASAISIQTKRGLELPLAKALSGDSDDLLPRLYIKRQGLYTLDGTAGDSKALEALRVEGQVKG